MGEIDKETYDLTFDHVNVQLQETMKEIGRGIPEISNLDKLLDESFKNSANRVWCGIPAI